MIGHTEQDALSINENFCITLVIERNLGDKKVTGDSTEIWSLIVTDSMQ